MRRPVGPMTGTAIENQRDHADLALVVYLEELLRDRRVLLVGETSPRVERRLSDVARTVDVVTRERRARRRGLPVRAWPTPAERGTWDAVLVTDLHASGVAEPARFDEIAGLVSEGLLIVAIDAAASEPGYEAFHGLVTSRFESARFLGQAPLSGFALAELGGSGTPEVAYDASQAELAPARFVAVAAPRSAPLDGYAVIATPRPAEAERPAPDPKYEREAEAARLRLEHSEKRLEQAQREIARSAQKLDESRHERARLEEALRARDAELEGAADRDAEAVAAAREECAALEKRLRGTAHELTSLRAEAERRGVIVRDLVEELRRTSTNAALSIAPSQGEIDAELTRVRAALEAAQRRAVEAEARRAELAFRVDELTADLASVGERHTDDAARKELEARLGAVAAERDAHAAHVKELQARVATLASERDAERARAAELEARPATPARDEAADAARSREIEERLAQASAHEERAAALVKEHAAAQGTARGMAAKVAELEELRMVAESRLALFEDDVRRGRERSRDLERRVAELEEALEVARMRPPTPAAPVGDAAREGQLFGALLKAREELAAREVERLELLGEIARLRAAVEIAAHETDANVKEAHRRASALEAEATLKARQLDDRNHELASVREERNVLASRVVTLESVLPPPPVEDTTKTDALERALDELRGERTGLALRAADAEAAARAALEALRGKDTLIASSEAAARADARRATEIAARLATRDGLVSRLQSALAHAAEREAGFERVREALEARLAQASEAIGALEAVSSVRSDEERRERDAIAGELSSEKARAGRLDTERASALEALVDVRESLARLMSGLGGASRAVAIPTAPEGLYREEIARLARDVDDRELMLRSLTAQLEERDDRIRALERVTRGEGGGTPDPARVLEAEERIARLSAELAEERRARERIEASSPIVSREAELRRLEQLLGDRDAQLNLLEGRVEGAGREEASLRQGFAEARSRLEQILAHLGDAKHGEAAEHAAELLRTLRKY